MIMAVALLIGADKAKDSDEVAKKEMKKLEGTWIGVSVEMSGRKVPGEDLKKAPFKLTLKAGKYTLKMPGETSRGSFKIDPTKKPKTVDSVPADGPSKGTTIQGIYEIKGDTLKACYDTSGNTRPKVFDTKDKEGYVLIVYKRVKNAK
jgi:uncharacterized protein (TIGR03067 family)